MQSASARVRIVGRCVPLSAVAAALVVLALVAYSPYLSAGFAADDFIFVSLLEGAADYDPALGLWFGEAESYKGFESLWWSEFEGSGGFLRPVASWVLTLLYHAFGRNALPYHACLLVLHGLAAFAAFLVLRRLSGRDAVALLAGLLYLVGEDHAMTVSWIATITDLLCALFLNLAFLCHIVARQEGRRWAFGASLVLFLAAMGSKETAAIYPLMVAAYELLRAGPDDAAREGWSWRGRLTGFRRQWWAWAVPLAVFAAYMVLYRSLVPPMRTLAYLDPFADPVRFAELVARNLPQMVLALLTPVLPSLVYMVPRLAPLAAGAGIVLAILLLWALRPFRRERALWLTLTVFVLGLLPGLATDPGERLLYFSAPYGMFAVAFCIAQLPRLRRAFGSEALPAAGAVGRAWGRYLLLAAVILPVALLFVSPLVWVPGMQVPEKTIQGSLPYIDEGVHEHVVYLNTSSSYNAFYLADIYRYYRGDYIEMSLLSCFNGRVSARLVSDRAIELKTDDSGWLGNMFARIVRGNPKLTAGDVHATDHVTATIVAATPSGTDVRHVRFDFTEPVTKPTVLILYYDGEQYRPWRPSAEWQLLNARIDPFGF